MKTRGAFKRKREQVRATMEEVERCVGKLNKTQRLSFGEEQIKLLFMTDEEVYHHCMDHPVQEINLKNGISLTFVVYESGHVPRLFKVITPQGEK